MLVIASMVILIIGIVLLLFGVAKPAIAMGVLGTTLLLIGINASAKT